MEKLNEKNKPIFVVTTKRLIIGIVVLVLVLLFAFWGGDGENKNSSVNIPNVVPNNNSANMNLPSDDSNPNVGNTTDTNNEAVGAGQSTEEVKEEPVTEPKPAQANQSQIDVVGLVGEYDENEIHSRGGFYGGFGKITKFVETKTLEISIGNYDKNGKFIEEKRFISNNKITSGVGRGCTTKHEDDIIKGEYYGCNYNGYFLFPDGSVTGTESTPVGFYVKIEDNLFVLEGKGTPYINENNLWMREWIDISKSFTD